MEFVITLDRNGKGSLQRQICEQLRHAILIGRLLPGQRLPSTRLLAQTLGVSRTTVLQSYDQLLSEGYFHSSQGSGTFVCQQLPEELHNPIGRNWEIHKHESPAPQFQLSEFGISLTDAQPFEPSVPPVSVRFRFGQPDLDRIPLKQWRKLWSRHCQLNHLEVFDYAPDSLGYRPLREAIAQYLARARAVHCDADQVIIVSDPLQAIDLLTRVLINRGDQVALENPSFVDIRRIFLAYGAQLCPIPVDESGMQVKQLHELPEGNTKLVYVTPSHQFPIGVTLSLSRRLELLAWAKSSGAMILEEDYDSEFRYTGCPIPSLQGLDPSAPVIYIGSFLEALFPALRVGYLVAPHHLIHVLARAKWMAARQAPLLEQYILTDFINEGHLERHIRRMRLLYGKRRQVIEQALISAFGQQVTILGEKAGTHLTIRLQSSLSDTSVLNRAMQVGVGLMSTRSFYLNNYQLSEYLLGYADLSEQKIQTGINNLSQAIKSN